jgi:hypothetical protein
MRGALASAILLVGVVSACNWGRRARDYPPAVEPGGAEVSLRLHDARANVQGELFAADTAGVVLGFGERGGRVRLARAPRSRISTLDVRHLRSEYDLRRGEELTSDKLARLAALSRFPQGLSGDLLARVLKILAQSEIEELR